MLFTLEKLVYKVVKQMQTLLSDELTHKLFELYQYEQARGCALFLQKPVGGAHVLAAACSRVEGCKSRLAGMHPSLNYPVCGADMHCSCIRVRI